MDDATEGESPDAETGGPPEARPEEGRVAAAADDRGLEAVEGLPQPVERDATGTPDPDAPLAARVPDSVAEVALPPLLLQPENSPDGRAEGRVEAASPRPGEAGGQKGEGGEEQPSAGAEGEAVPLPPLAPAPAGNLPPPADPPCELPGLSPASTPTPELLELRPRQYSSISSMNSSCGSMGSVPTGELLHVPEPQPRRSGGHLLPPAHVQPDAAGLAMRFGSLSRGIPNQTPCVAENAEEPEVDDPARQESVRMRSIFAKGARLRPSISEMDLESQMDKDSQNDWSTMLSAVPVGDGEDSHDEHATYPFTLLLFVCVLAVVSGLVVSLFHYGIKYSGCPLGISGCNKGKYAFVLIERIEAHWGGKVPEDVVYIALSLTSSAMICFLHTRLRPSTSFQLQTGGTIQALVAVARGTPIRLKCAILRFVITCLFLGFGGTLGAEGPAIQVCTSLAGSIGWAVGMRAPATQSLLATIGFASGFAASFNSPLAGILFAMEELGHITKFVSKNIIIVILLASVTATAASRATHEKWQFVETEWAPELTTSSEGGGVDKVFGQSTWMLVAVPIAVACSGAGYLITKGVSRLQRLLDDWYGYMPTWLPLMGAALVTSCLGSICFRATGLRGVWGIGAEALQYAFDGQHHGWEFVVFGVCKALAMIVSVAARAPGDVLEPILVSGGFLGGLFGYMLESLVKDEAMKSLVKKPCIVFGMVGLFSSAFRFPLTPVVITIELMGVDTYALVLPTVLCSFTAITVSNRLFAKPLLDEMLSQEGIDLQGLSHLAVMKELKYEEENGAEDVNESEEQEDLEAQLRRRFPPSPSASGISIPQAWRTMTGESLDGPVSRELSNGSGDSPTARHDASSSHNLSPGRRKSGISSSSSFFRDIEQSVRKLARHVEVDLVDTCATVVRARHLKEVSSSEGEEEDEESEVDRAQSKNSDCGKKSPPGSAQETCRSPKNRPRRKASNASSSLGSLGSSRRVSLVSAGSTPGSPKNWGRSPQGWESNSRRASRDSNQGSFHSTGRVSVTNGSSGHGGRGGGSNSNGTSTLLVARTPKAQALPIPHHPHPVHHPPHHGTPLQTVPEKASRRAPEVSVTVAAPPSPSPSFSGQRSCSPMPAPPSPSPSFSGRPMPAGGDLPDVVHVHPRQARKAHTARAMTLAHPPNMPGQLPVASAGGESVDGCHPVVRQVSRERAARAHTFAHGAVTLPALGGLLHSLVPSSSGPPPSPSPSAVSSSGPPSSHSHTCSEVETTGGP